MKILAIRGENIASLQKFAVDFSAEPLRSAGIFAITGPTGAGKSSLLDAMCLALFAKAPRFDGVSAQSGELESALGTFKLNAPENLIRRGCTTGFAEVDFAGAKGEAFRARWSYRAGKRKGAASQQEFSLHGLDDGQVVVQGAKINEYLRAVEERLGWTYEQFTRAVLLAQGRFAEFLRAKDDERADLLEKLTGTDIYSRISVQVFQRAKDETAQLTVLQQRAQGLEPLTEDARAELEARLAELRQNLTMTTAQEEEWRVLLHTLRQAAQCSEQLADLARQKEQCLADGLQSKLDCEAAELALQNAKAHLDALEPQVHKAQALDARIAERTEAQSAHQRTQALATEKLQALEQEQRQASSQLVALQEALSDHVVWVANNPRLVELAGQWNLARHLLEEMAKLEKQCRQLAADEASQAKAVLQTEQEHRRLADEAARLQAACGNVAPDFLMPQREQARQLGLELDNSLQYESLRRSHAASVQKVKDLQETWQAALQAEAVAMATEQVARQSYERAQLAQSAHVEGLRAQLQEQVACPVCGALEHPFAQGGTALQQLCTDQHEAWQQANGRLNEARRTLHTTQAQHEQLQLQCGQEAAQLQKLVEPNAQWRMRFDSIDSADWDAWCAEQRAEQCDHERELEARLAAALAAQKAETAAADAQAHHAGACAAHAVALGQQHEARAKQNAVHAQLDNLLPADWSAQWQRSGERYIATLDGQVQDVVKRQQAQDQNATALAGLEQKIVVINSQIIERQRELLTLQQTGEQKSQELVALQSDRKAVLGGEPWQPLLSAAQKQVQTSEAELKRIGAIRERFRDLYQQLQGSEKSQQETLDKLRMALGNSTLYNTSDLATHDFSHSGDVAAQRQSQLAQALQEARAQEAQLAVSLQGDNERRDNLGVLRQQMKAQSERVDLWSQLRDLIGSQDGKAFRKIAQQFTLEQLLEYANGQLANITPRYRLEAMPGSMNFCITDAESYGEKRPVHTLSGGETFIVSLALALGLAQMAAGSLQVESLFIDEGFGTLDPETLRSVMVALSSLQAQGRKVGLITHVEEMKHQIPVRIEVSKLGQGASVVKVVG
jgi:DNA repair protein SbcC/Rad50